MNKRKKIIVTSLFSMFVLANAAWIAPKIISLNAEEKNPIEDIEGLQVWLDATSLNLNDGAKVSTWQNLANYDLTNVSNGTQVDPTRQPVYVAKGSMGGLPTVKFNKASYMDMGAFNLDDLTIFAVINPEDVSGHHEFFSHLTGSPYAHNWYFNFEDGFNFGWGYKSGSNVSFAANKVQLDSATPYILTGQRDGLEGRCYVNGWLESTFKGGEPNHVNDQVRIGGTNNETFDGELGELLVFDRSLTNNELDIVENYLEEKWGISYNTDALLKGISVDGVELKEFYPSTFKYSYLTQDEIKKEDIVVRKWDENDTIEIIKEGKTFYVHVTSNETGMTQVYEVEINSMNYDYNQIRNLSLNEVKINDGFWGDLITQYSDYTINYIFDMFDWTGSFDNFDRVANGERKWQNNLSNHAGEILIPTGSNRLIGKKDGDWFWGQEPWREGLILETIQAAGNFIIENSKQEDTQESAMALQKRVEAYVNRIYAAALSTTGTDFKGKVIDGYLSTYNLLKSNSILDEADGGAVYNHDLYNLGCYIEAGISWYNATGDTKLLYAATRFCEFLVDYIYGTETQKGYVVMSPHAITEETLLDLYVLYKNNPELVALMEERYTNVNGLSAKDRYVNFKIRVDKYLDICNLWVTERGNYEDRYGHTSYGVYAQDQCHHEDMTEALGHAVRANLWYSGVTAIGNYTQNYSYIQSMKRIWDNIINTQMYVTGGTGASESLGEAYAGSFVLPQNGYCETCASVGMAFYADNMFQVFGEAEYAEVVELELYNGILGSLSLEGNAFYYTNPLVSENYVRPNWSGATPCCPPMYMKMFGNLPTYIYATTGENLFVNQYIASTADLEIAGEKAQIIQYTDLPNGDEAIFQIKANGKLPVHLRMPSWASMAVVKVNGVEEDVSVNEAGYIVVDKMWTGNDRIEIKFTKEVKLLRQDEVVYNKGQVAVQYGPFIYCAESEDNQVNSIINLIQNTSFVVTENTNFVPEYTEEMFELTLNSSTKKAWGVNILKGQVVYDEENVATLTLVPFYIRGNRVNNSMIVWFNDTKNVIEFEGNKTTYDFNDKSLDMFDVYGEMTNGYQISNGVLNFDSRSEYKAIYNKQTDLSEFEVSMKVNAYYIPQINAGLYIMASNPGHNMDKITALNIQIEKSIETNSYNISLFEFDSERGYIRKIEGSPTLSLDGKSINLRVIVQDGFLYVFTNHASYSLITYKLSSSYKAGSVGIRSMLCNTEIEEFSVTTK